MPLPLIVPIFLGVGGLFGVGKTVKAAIDNSEANGIGKNAAAVVADAESALENGKHDCNSTLRSYGEQKLKVINKEVQDFVDLFGRLKNVRLDHSPELDRLHVGDFTEVALEDLKHTCSFASQFAASTVAGAGAGAITAFGAYGGTMMLASAGTGTAISALSGVAATNATLAWLGGGTLAAGGYGMAGGTMVLGIMVTGPALLVLGSVLGARASKKLNEARANLEKARTYETETRVVLEKLKAIIEVTIVGGQLLDSLRARLHDANVALKEVVRISGVDYSTYAVGTKDTVFKAVKYAQLVKKLVDTPVLKEDGTLAEKVMIGFKDLREGLYIATYRDELPDRQSATIPMTMGAQYLRLMKKDRARGSRRQKPRPARPTRD
jgi:hypothetical protein